MAAQEAVTYFVRYKGLPEADGDFLAYYSKRHAEILAQMPGLLRLVLHVPMAWHDPFPVTADKTDFLAEMTFANEAAFKAALASLARAEARADLVNLPRGDARVTHQAMRSLRVV